MGHKARFWSRTKKLAVGIMFLPLVLSFPITWPAIDMNKQQAYCTYSRPGEFWLVRLNGDPCYFTLANIYNILQPFLIITFLIQAIFWFFVWLEYRAMKAGDRENGG